MSTPTNAPAPGAVPTYTALPLVSDVLGGLGSLQDLLALLRLVLVHEGYDGRPLSTLLNRIDADAAALYRSTEEGARALQGRFAARIAEAHADIRAVASGANIYGADEAWITEAGLRLHRAQDTLDWLNRALRDVL